MLFLSFNIRGLGGAPKLATLGRILDLKRPALQETMTEGGKFKDSLKRYLKHWHMEALDVDGQSGGLMTASTPEIVCHNITPYKDAIGSKLEDLEIELRF